MSYAFYLIDIDIFFGVYKLIIYVVKICAILKLFFIINLISSCNIMFMQYLLKTNYVHIRKAGENLQNEI